MRKLLTVVSVLAIAPMMAVAQDGSGYGLYNLRAQLSPLMEMPPLKGLDAGGNAEVTILAMRDSAGAMTGAVVQFRVNVDFGGAPETITGMHIHKSPAGVNGRVVINSQIGEPIDVQRGIRIFREVDVMDMAGMETVKEILANPAGFYVNVHTTSNPGGIMRGQLEGPSPVNPVEVDKKLDEVKANTAGLADVGAKLKAIETKLNLIGRRLGLLLE